MRLWRDLGSFAVGAGLLSGAASQGISLTVTDPSSLKAAAKIAARNMMKTYVGNQPGQIPGVLPGPYYWWEAGAMFGQLIHYANLTGDTQYNDIVKQALQFQTGSDDNYMPSNQSKDLGNDDQVFWAFSAMDAAESGFDNPDPGQPSWLALAQAVFNSQVPRWETTTCGGGLRWQIYPFNAGYTYKNTISTGGLFQLSARLARYTGNQTYADWAEKTYDWLWNSPMMAHSYNVWDGAYMDNNCTRANELYWTYNVGTILMGAAYMYDYTKGNATWLARVNGLVSGTDVFFVQSAGANNPPKPAAANGSIMAEVACEFPTPQTCNYDEPSFKAYLSRWLHITAVLVPSTADAITPKLQASAQACAQQCTGQGTNMCGRRWYQTVWDGYFGVGEQMSAMSIFQNNLSGQKPLSAKTGGNSTSNPAAGENSDDNGIVQDPVYTRPITTGDRAGAGILTVLGLGLCISGTAWMIL